MSIEKRIKPISWLKANSAEIIANLAKAQRRW